MIKRSLARDWSDAPSPTEKTLEEAPAGFWNLTGKNYEMEGPMTWGTSVVKSIAGSQGKFVDQKDTTELKQYTSP